MLGSAGKAPIFEARMFILTGHQPVIDKLVNTEYK
jgi:hypothetical protein